jgi:hypothetical protein
MEATGWKAIFTGPRANAIPLSGITVKSGPVLGRAMPKLDSVRKLATAMLAADQAERHLQAAWAALLKPDAASAGCGHPRDHAFPHLPLVADGGVALLNFPTLEMCIVCGTVQAAYPGEPHDLADLGYSPMQSKK